MDDIAQRIRPNRTITGMSAILLTFDDEGAIDWTAFSAHVARTVEAGLTPAVNMDTGYVQLLSAADRARVLDVTVEVAGSDFVAGAYVADEAGAAFDRDAHVAMAADVAERGGIPVLFPSWGLASLDDEAWVAAIAAIAEPLERCIGFELGTAFVPYGRILSLAAYRSLLDVPQCLGAKHSSLHRQPEWDRLALRDSVRPDFKVFTGNDLAIDMVMYGSDYLLGLSTFAPAEFARRDALWAAGDPAFHELNDLLQYLGQLAFRAPVPAYRHDAAIVHELRGWARTDATPPGAPRRPSSDRALLADVLERLGDWS